MSLDKWKPLSPPTEASLLRQADKLMRENTAYIDTSAANGHRDRKGERQRKEGDREGGNRETGIKRHKCHNIIMANTGETNIGKVRKIRRRAVGEQQIFVIYSSIFFLSFCIDSEV